MYITIFSFICITWIVGPQFIVAASRPKLALIVTSTLCGITIVLVVLKEFYGVNYV